ncbi:MipA/OmpV family protein [Edwardsiella tarda]|uniref:MipA/OmpV family protein n=1 Tax=Edwardsiella tarda TaxID=636 RepID=UPI00351C637D
MKKRTLCALGALSLLVSAAAQAGTWSIGASALVSPDPYRGESERVYPVPMVNYDSDDFYFHSLTAGYYLWKDQQDQLSATVFYSPWRYRASDSDDWRMKRLDNRYATVMAGLSYSHHESWGTLRAAFSGDILDNSNGLVGDLAYLYTWRQGDWSFTPGVGVTWNSANQNNYYFGVSGDESRRSTLDQYSPKNSWSPYLELTAHYRINAKWNAFFAGRYVSLSDEITNSPMISKDYTGMLWSGVTYTF